MMKPQTHLKSGESFFGKNGQVIMTNLGSCTAVCIYDKKLRVGGMVHFLLPAPEDSPATGEARSNPLNFGSTAIRSLLKEMKDFGSNRSDLEAIVIGGVSQPNDVPTQSAEQICQLNFRMAVGELQKFGIQIKKQRGCAKGSGLRARFHTDSGEVFVQAIENNKAEPEIQSVKVVAGNSGPQKARVLIVDDSDPIRRILNSVLAPFPEIEVVGSAASAAEAEILRKETNPDVMALDIHMPEKDGVTYLAEVMAQSPLPVVMVTDLSLKEASPVMRALELGAFEYVQKPSFSEIKELGPRLRDIFLAAAQAKERITKRRRVISETLHNKRKSILNSSTQSPCRLIALGASTGGTEALREVFARLPEKTPPIVVVQHMPPVFTKAFAESLNEISTIQVKEAAQFEVLQPSCAYFAPGGKQMRLMKTENGALAVQVTDDPPMNRFKPSVDYLFNSIVALGISKDTHAALFTGMGDDGARGLRDMKEAGAFTIAQDEETCVVFGMPKVAIEMGGASLVAPLEDIAEALFRNPKASRVA